MKIKLQRVNHDDSDIVEVAEVPRRGDAVSQGQSGDRTVLAVDWQTGTDRPFAAIVWVS